MRLEDLFARARYFAAQDAAHDHHAALLALFEITDVAARADLKTDLLQELERQKQVLGPLRSNPQIDAGRARGAAGADRRASTRSCSRRPARSAPHLRDNEWLMAIKQRTGDSRRRLRVRPARLSLVAAPGSRRAAQRPRRLDRAVRADPRRRRRSCCKLLRDNGRASRHTALPRRVPADADDDQGRAAAAPHARRATSPCVPEISANKYALNIRFLGVSGMDRGAVFDQRRRVRADVLQPVGQA